MSTSNDERWRLDHDSRSFIPMRAGELLYAVLGPRATLDLIEALRQGSSDDRSELMEGLRNQLESCVGRSPSMLLALATAVGATARLFGDSDGVEGAERSSALDQKLGETEKYLGDLLMQAWEQFGFDESRFRRWFEESDGVFWNDAWPPRGIGYSQFELPPETPGTTDQPLLDERFAILEFLDRRYGIADGIVHSERPLHPDDARAFARLTAATAQWWRWRLAGGAERPTSPYDDDMFTIHLSESMLWFPSSSWSVLTDARMICFVADLAEILRMILVFDPSDAMTRLQDVLLLICAGNEDLLRIAEQAGAALPFPESADRFAEAFRAIRHMS